jgi:uncharacterized lipoprotein YmbA
MRSPLTACCLLLAACSLLAPRPDPSRFFVLDAMPTASATAGVAARRSNTLLVGVGPLTFPSYLRRTEIVTRLGPNRVTFSDTARWAEPVESSFPRLLSRDLSLMLGTDRVVRYPWLLTTRPDYAVAIDVLRFERTANGDGDLAAHLTFSDRDGRVLDGRDVHVLERAQGSGMDGSVAALSTALVRLSREIADMTLRLEDVRPRSERMSADPGASTAGVRSVGRETPRGPPGALPPPRY